MPYRIKPLENEPSKMVATFQDVFDSLLDMHAPLKLKKLRNEFTPCLTRSVKDLMANRDKRKKAATENPSL